MANRVMEFIFTHRKLFRVYRWVRTKYYLIAHPERCWSRSKVWQVYADIHAKVISH